MGNKSSSSVSLREFEELWAKHANKKFPLSFILENIRFFFLEEWLFFY